MTYSSENSRNGVQNYRAPVETPFSPTLLKPVTLSRDLIQSANDIQKKIFLLEQNEATAFSRYYGSLAFSFIHALWIGVGIFFLRRGLHYADPTFSLRNITLGKTSCVRFGGLANPIFILGIGIFSISLFEVSEFIRQLKTDRRDLATISAQKNNLITQEKDILRKVYSEVKLK